MADPVRDFLLDADGDLANVGGDFAVVAGAAAVQQGIAVRVRTFLGEIWLDEDQGVDWVDQVLVKDPNPLTVRALIAEAIADTPDVLEVSGSGLVLTGAREATIDYAVRDAYSTAPVNGSVSTP